MISFGQYAQILRSASIRMRPELENVAAVTAQTAAELARGYIGHLQPEWEPLADSTKRQKAALGFSAPDFAPLLRSGVMRDSYEGASEGLMGGVFSNDKVALYHELGTSRMPPRPVMAKAVVQAIPEIESMVPGIMEELLAE